MSMIYKKLILVTIMTAFLNGCVQNSAFLGPIYTYGSTGNALQAGLSYTTNKTVHKLHKKNKNKQLKEENYTELQKVLKIRITETRKKLKITK